MTGEANNPQLSVSVYASIEEGQFKILRPSVTPAVPQRGVIRHLLHQESMRSQMMATQDNPVTTSANDTVNPTVVAPGSQPTTKEVVDTMPSVRDNMKRAFIAFDDDAATDLRLPPSALLMPEPYTNGINLYRYSPLSWFAAPFRLFRGGFVFHVRSDREDRIVSWAPFARWATTGSLSFTSQTAAYAYGPTANTNTVVAPFVAQTDVLLVPKTYTDVENIEYSFGHLLVNTPANSTTSSPLHVSARVGDNFALGGLYAVPRIRLATTNSPNDFFPGSEGVVDVPEFFTMSGGASHNPRPFFPMEWFFSREYTMISTGPAYPKDVSSITVRTEDLTDAQLIFLGVISSAGASRNVLVGVTHGTLVDLSTYKAVVANLTVSWSGSSGDSNMPVAGPADMVNQAVLNDGLIVADAAVLSEQSWVDHTLLAEYYGVTNEQIPIAQPTTTASISVPLKGLTDESIRYGLFGTDPLRALRLIP